MCTCLGPYIWKITIGLPKTWLPDSSGKSIGFPGKELCPADLLTLFSNALQTAVPFRESQSRHCKWVELHFQYCLVIFFFFQYSCKMCQLVRTGICHYLPWFSSWGRSDLIVNQLYLFCKVSDRLGKAVASFRFVLGYFSSSLVYFSTQSWPGLALFCFWGWHYPSPLRPVCHVVTFHYAHWHSGEWVK